VRSCSEAGIDGECVQISNVTRSDRQ
jgi:hypothetical protein